MSFIFNNLIDLLSSLRLIAIIAFYTFESFNHLHVLCLFLFLFIPFRTDLFFLKHQLLGGNRQLL